ncbi:MAG: SDR family oxidoreductase [candidate division Zixibacteria bacterium]|nr:SDR family oxidoreductase [candidate division Zixibacteria bacterium]
MPNSVFKNNVVIITGASSGIGEELALQLADQGAWLTLAARSEDKLETLASECRNRGGKALVVTADVASEDRCVKIIDETLEEYKRIDTLINNAGYGSAGHLHELPDLRELEKVMDVNFRGSVYCTYHALPHIIKTRGRIVGISSVLGKVAAWGGTAYCASKFAMAGFFDALRIEQHGSGVSVTMVYPGYVVTKFAGNVVKPDGEKMGEKGLRFYGKSMMSAEKAARIIIDAAAKRKREKVLSGLGKFAVFMNKLSPKLVDQIALKIQAERKRRTEGK